MRTVSSIAGDDGQCLAAAGPDGFPECERGRNIRAARVDDRLVVRVVVFERLRQGAVRERGAHRRRPVAEPKQPRSRAAAHRKGGFTRAAPERRGACGEDEADHVEEA